MEFWEAIVLGIVQGLTEFLPVSSSGHLQIFNTLFGLQGEENLTFAVAVHAATVCSTIVVFRAELGRLIVGFSGSAGTRRRCTWVRFCCR